LGTSINEGQDPFCVKKIAISKELEEKGFFGENGSNILIKFGTSEEN